MAQSKDRRLILHFDINKTLIVSDPASGAAFHSMVNSLLSESVWGRIAALDPEIPREQQLDLWTPASEEPSIEPPEPGLITYGEFVEDYLQLSRPDRKRLKFIFTEPGQPGHRYRAFYEAVVSKMTLPHSARATTLPSLQTGFYYILPSFYHLICDLRRHGRDFRLVFRTFGLDLLEIAQEFNAFCQGAHPCFGDVRLDHDPDFRVKLPWQAAKITRLTGDEGPSIMLSYIDQQQLVSVARGWRDVAQALDELLRINLVLGVRDDFAYWHASGEADTAGKPLLIDRSDTTREMHIFFDDNIERNRAHIVDARHRLTGAALSFNDTNKRHLCKVHPYWAIMDDEYFIRRVAECEASHDR